MKNYILVLLPLLACLASPWIHQAMYHNMILACPDLNSQDAHLLTLLGQIMSFVVTGVIASCIRW